MKNNAAKATLGRVRELNQVIKDEDHLKKLGETILDDISDGKANIHVYADGLYNPLSGNRQLSPDIFDYIEEQANLLPSLIPLRLILHGVPENEQDGIPYMIREHYRATLQDQLWDKRSNRNKMIYMILIGVIFIGAYLLLAISHEDSLFLEILSVIGSFSLWEAANCFLIESRSIHRELRETAQFLTMEVTFAELV